MRMASGPGAVVSTVNSAVVIGNEPPAIAL